jgi:hypothetical protein
MIPSAKSPELRFKARSRSLSVAPSRTRSSPRGFGQHAAVLVGREIYSPAAPWSMARLPTVYVSIPLAYAKARADERTRTADLLITSDPSRVAGVGSDLRIPHM